MTRAKKPGKPPRTVENRKLVRTRPREAERLRLCEKVVYTGNPAHKRDPGDFGLNPPAAAKRNKTLCDNAEIFRKKRAQELLSNGVAEGLWDERTDQGFPKIVWCVEGELVLEAQLENATKGEYHGYPLLDTDPYRQVVFARYQEFSAR